MKLWRRSGSYKIKQVSKNLKKRETPGSGNGEQEGTYHQHRTHKAGTSSDLSVVEYAVRSLDCEATWRCTEGSDSEQDRPSSSIPTDNLDDDDGKGSYGQVFRVKDLSAPGGKQFEIDTSLNESVPVKEKCVSTSIDEWDSGKPFRDLGLNTKNLLQFSQKYLLKPKKVLKPLETHLWAFIAAAAELLATVWWTHLAL